MKLKEPQWRRQGQMPDYRFSLANERTFLAWIRTAMAILAGAIAVDQLTPPRSPRPPVRIALCLVLAVIGALLAVEAYRPWSLRNAPYATSKSSPRLVRARHGGLEDRTPHPSHYPHYNCVGFQGLVGPVSET